MKTFNCTHGSNGDSPTELSRQDIDDITKSLFSEMPEKKESEIVYGGSRLRENFIGLCPPKLKEDLEKCPGFVALRFYPDDLPLISEDEFGTIGAIRCLLRPSSPLNKLVSVFGERVYCMPVVCMLHDSKEYKKFIKDLKIDKDMNAINLHATRHKDKKDV